MRKHRLYKKQSSAFKLGAVMALSVLMALQTVGCGLAGKEENMTAAESVVQAGDRGNSAESDEQGQSEDNGKEAGAQSGQSKSGNGESGNAGSDQSHNVDEENREAESGNTEGKDTKASGQAEGDAGIEAEPGMPIKAGVKAPDFTANLIDGTSISLSGYSGKPVIINFWATWCGPCVKEMPAFERLKADYGDQIGIIAVNCGEDAETVKDFASENGYTFPIALDEEYQVSMLYPTNSIPYTVIVDAAGKVTHVSAGALDADTMYERYKEALGL